MIFKYLLIIDTYNFTFYKIKIGNSEENKFTLRENADGVPQDLISAVTSEAVQEVVIGEYEFCRIIVGKTISLTGSYDDIILIAPTMILE